MRSQKDNFTGKLVSDELAAVIFGLAVIIGVIALCAFIMTRIDVNVLGMSVMSTVSLAVGCFCGGYVSARRRKRSGLLMGALCGIFIFLVIMIFGALFTKAASGFSPSAKLITAVVSAAAGGVVGVNSKKL